MPKKTVREMNIWERLHYSLGAHIFHAVIIFALLLSAAAIGFGFFLYSSSVSRDYRSRTWLLSKTGVHVVDLEAAKKEAEKVLERYDRLQKEGREPDQAYLDDCALIQDETFEEIRTRLREVQEENGAVAAYIAALDLQGSRMIFIADSDASDSFCPPGSFDDMKADEIDALANGAKPGMLDTLFHTPVMPSVISRMPKYGYRCTAGTKIFEIGSYPVMVFFDTDMNRAAYASRSFLIQYMVLLAVVAFLLASVMVWHMKRTVVNPINELSDAARAYSLDKANGESTGKHFEALNIRTGDEIENLCFIMKDMENDLADYIRDLTRVTAEKERIHTELSLAGKIQESMIPSIYPAFPDMPEFDLYATMDPAKEIGGDFYDFFLLDEDHLALVTADVSDKGIPAALMMMSTKILLQNVTKLERYSPAAVLEVVNREICSNNKTEMFVTVWLGILEISTGKLRAASAGHEYPALQQDGGDFTLYKDKHGFILGGLEDARYRDYEIVLKPGDALFEYTDGVTEAADSEEELFGTDRMLRALNLDPNAEAGRILQNVKQEIERFTGDTMQSDDLTMLCLRYKGKNAGSEDAI